MREFYLVRVNRDDSDVHAGELLIDALQMAAPDPGDTVEAAWVTAADPGAARLVIPPTWIYLGVGSRYARLLGE